ncbi:MAG: hypothetical protein ACYDEQ_04435 [Desulfocucumaceae bacterium]
MDYAILEKTRDLLMVRGDFGWDDVGSWAALKRIDPLVTEDGNVLRGRGVFLDTRESVIISPHRVVAAIGVSDLVVVDDGQDLKKLVEALQIEGFEDCLK